MSNGFGLDDKEYENLIKDDGYFKGFVAAKLVSIEKRLDTGDRTFNCLRGQINRNRWYMGIAFGGILVVGFFIKYIFPFFIN